MIPADGEEALTLHAITPSTSYKIAVIPAKAGIHLDV
jgi:hypothetical protein